MAEGRLLFLRARFRLSQLFSSSRGFVLALLGSFPILPSGSEISVARPVVWPERGTNPNAGTLAVT
jgi:hypothetical protein